MRRFAFFLVLGCVLVTMTACEGGHGEYEEMELTKEDMESLDSTPVPSVDASRTDEIETISIYTVDSVEEQLVPLKVMVSSERITPEYIVEEVIRNLDEKVEVTEIQVKDNRVYVMFHESYVPVSGCSKVFEELILDCISNSLLDNIPYIEEVVFQCSDRAYQSDNFSFGEEEVYRSK